MDNTQNSTDKYVCEHCIGDVFVKQYIREHGNDEARCNYCDQKGKVILLNKLYKDLIKGGIECEYCLPSDEDVEDDDFYRKWSTEVLVNGVLCNGLDLDFENCEEFREDLIHEIEHDYEITGDAWVRLEDLIESEYDKYQYSWDNFSEKVKHKVRYFFRSEEEKINSEGSSEEFILDKIGDLVSDNGLVQPLYKNKEICRARENNKQDKYGIDEIGPLRPENTISNRMSPPGIVMFYGALDYETAIMEIVSESTKKVTVGTFKLLEDIQVLNLTDIPIPSLFDEKSRSKRSGLLFLNEFAEELARPIDKSVTSHHYEYVPSQVMTEYFRYMYKTMKDENIQGIIYSSSKVEEGECVVLFFDIENCKKPDPNEKPIYTYKLMPLQKHYLELIDTKNYRIEHEIKISECELVFNKNLYL